MMDRSPLSQSSETSPEALSNRSKSLWQRPKIWAFGVSALPIMMVVVIGVMLWAARSELNSGDHIHGANAVNGLRETLELALGSYHQLVQLIALSFGVVAFLVTYQLEKGVTPSGRAWLALGLGLVFLTGGLGLALLGADMLLYMLSMNTVDLGLDWLQYARMMMYLFLVIALALILFFATTVALGLPKKPTAE